MSVLTIQQGHLTKEICFTPPVPLSSLLRSANMADHHPCGGHGKCGKCAVVLTGSVSPPTTAEAQAGTRLSCQAVITGDAQVFLPAVSASMQIVGGSSGTRLPASPMPGRYGAAVDIGTTTLAMQVFDLSTGRCVGASTMMNPQASFASDVIGRMEASMNGYHIDLQRQTEDSIHTLLSSACQEVPPDAVCSMVITGNTTMLYLLTGRNPESLSRAPFHADELFGTDYPFHQIQAYLPDCLHAFVGADTTCAMLACGMLDHSASALLCDIGTNGELALWHKGRLYIASTAAGPAFEGAGIQCGCSSLPGAIDSAALKDDEIVCHTIGDHKAIGICGSGLLDIIAALLDAEMLDESGYLEDQVVLRDGICITQQDVRAVQLAKAAIAAGIACLLDAADCSAGEISAFCLAGGFGSRMNPASAVRIGLIPAAFQEIIRPVGNAALDGAAMLLMDTSLRTRTAAMRRIAQHVRLDGSPAFSQAYVDAMTFEPL